MKIYKAFIEIICGKYSFRNTKLVVAKNLGGAKKKIQKDINEENSLYSGGVLYKSL